MQGLQNIARDLQGGQHLRPRRRPPALREGLRRAASSLVGGGRVPDSSTCSPCSFPEVALCGVRTGGPLPLRPLQSCSLLVSAMQTHLMTSRYTHLQDGVLAWQQHLHMLHARSSREHQAKHWGAGHKSLCKKLALGIAAGLHARGPAVDSAAAEEGVSGGKGEATAHHSCSLVPSR